MADAGDLEVHFLDVGQGDSTFILFPNKKTLLIDFGSIKNSKTVGGDALTFLRNKLDSADVFNKKTLDHLVLTHGDEDHYNLLPQLVNGITVKNVYWGGLTTHYSTAMQDIIAKILSPNDTHRPPNQCFPDQAFFEQCWFNEDGVNVYLLSSNYPTANGSGKNNTSLVIMLEYNSRKVILMGDAEREVENFIMKNFEKDPIFLQCDVLKMGHHGSRNASTKNWIATVSPKCVFVSADGKWEHPYGEAMDRAKASKRLYKHVPEHGWIQSNPPSYVLPQKRKRGECEQKPYKQNNSQEAMFTNIYKVEYDKDYSYGAWGAHYTVFIDSEGSMQIDGQLVGTNEYHSGPIS